MSQSPQLPQSELSSSFFLGVAEKTHPEALTAAMVAEALRAIGRPASVAACEFVRMSSYNHNYRIEVDGEPAELRVWYDASPAGAAAEMALHRRLASSGLPVPRVIVRFAIDGRPACMLTQLAGEEGPNYMPATLKESYVETAADMAGLIAKVHVCAIGLQDLDYREPAWLSNLQSWKPMLDMAKMRGEGERASAIVQRIDAAAARLRTLCDTARLPVGVVHGCPAPFCVLTDNGRISALLDFDSAHRDYLVFDIAHLMSQWGVVADRPSGQERYHPTLVKRILGAYHAVRPLSAEEREALALAIPLRYCIDWLRIWNGVGDTNIVPFSVDEYLDAFEVSLFDDPEWVELIASS